MVTDLFTRGDENLRSPTAARQWSAVEEARGRTPTSGRRGRPLSNGSNGNPSRSSRQYGARQPQASVTSSTDGRKLFVDCAEQISKNLKAHVGSPSALHTLASYYTYTEPIIEGRPFCVSLSYSTFLFHMQMSRISDADVQLYAQLITAVLAQLSDTELLDHPFVTRVLRDAVFGLPSPTCRGGAHCVVLVPPQQYRGFATLVTAVVDQGRVPLDIFYQWQDKLSGYCAAASPIVANRALALLVRTVRSVSVEEQVTALQSVLWSKPEKMNVDFLLACYERLQRCAEDPANGPSRCRAIAIHCSEIFLRFRSPIRREFAERFLYPSLAHGDMRQFLEIPATRYHLCTHLLRQCTPTMGLANPFYLCLCALMQSAMNDATDGAVELIALINCQMPHAAYFMATLAVDSRMSVTVFAKVVIALTRGAGIAMSGHQSEDEVAEALQQSRTSVYNVLFSLREVVRNCSTTASRRATDTLRALRVAVPMKSIEALGKLSAEAFDGHCDAAVDPQLLCAELAMVLHELHIDVAMDAGVEYFRDAAAHCRHCGGPKNSTVLCPVNGIIHLTGQSSVVRVLSTIAECAGTKAVEERIIRYLRDPAMQLERSVHFLVFHVLSHAGQHRSSLFTAIEPYLRTTLVTVLSADKATADGLVTSTQKAYVLMLHVRVAILLASSTDPTYWESILRAIAGLQLRSNHDAVVVWYLSNLMLRRARGNMELMPTDPIESGYALNFPHSAPASTTTADNAQLALKLMDRAHGFSSATKKLVGCCVCRLIQDFNMQAPNIVNSLLSPFGFVSAGLEAVHELALPVGAGSRFWSFFLDQMKRSAPARTALMAALAKSMSQRFRIASPADAVTLAGIEATGHPFAIMMYETMKRSGTVARVVVHLVSQWMRQHHATPGKFVCLVYMCIQLVNVVRHRGQGLASVEVETETNADRAQFDEAVERGVAVLRSQLPRIQRTAELVKKDNREFYRLVRRLKRGIVAVVSQETGELLGESRGYDSSSEVETGCLEEDVGAGHSQGRGAKVTSIDAHEGAYDELGSAPLPLLYNQADDVIFDDACFSAMNDDDADAEKLSNAVASSRGTSAVAVRRQEGAHVSEQLVEHDWPASATQSATASVASRGARAGRVASGGRVSEPVSQLGEVEATESEEDGGHVRLVGRFNLQRGVSSRIHSSRPRPASVSVGTQTVAGAMDAGVKGKDSEKGGQMEDARRGVARVASGEAGSARRAWRSSRSSGTRTPGLGLSPSSPSHGDGDSRCSDAREGREEEARGEERAPMIEAVAAPSSIVMEYLMTHQTGNSLFHELQQFNQSWLSQQAEGFPTANCYHAPHMDMPPVPQVSLMPVTINGRSNNYHTPHVGSPAPNNTVMTAMSYVITPGGDAAERAAAEYANDGIPGVEVRGPLSGTCDKRYRSETNSSGANKQTMKPAPSMAAPARGLQYFLSQRTGSVLKDFSSMQPSGTEGQNMHDTAAREASCIAEKDPTRPTATPPRGSGLTTSGTPHNHMVIPSCFVEQKNDTAVREIRQVLGVATISAGDRSSPRKRPLRRSSGIAPCDKENSSVWWAEVSHVPMPDYAADPQYSMELF